MGEEFCEQLRGRTVQPLEQVLTEKPVGTFFAHTHRMTASLYTVLWGKSMPEQKGTKTLTNGLAHVAAFGQQGGDPPDPPNRWLETIDDVSQYRSPCRLCICNLFYSVWLLNLRFSNLHYTTPRSFFLLSSWCCVVINKTRTRGYKVNGCKNRIVLGTNSSFMQPPQDSTEILLLVLIASLMVSQTTPQTKLSGNPYFSISKTLSH